MPLNDVTNRFGVHAMYKLKISYIKLVTDPIMDLINSNVNFKITN